METITWLHISDLHFHVSHAYDTNIVLQALLRDVDECIEEDGLKPDFVVVTGDIAFSGNSEEYRLARQFFNDLLRVTHLGPDRLFPVPGNHDVDRSAISFAANVTGEKLADLDSVARVLADPRDRHLMFERFAGYAEFINDYLGKHSQFDDKQYFYVRTLVIGGQHIALLGLNSAWLSASDNDRNRLILGERQVRAALQDAEDATLRLVLVHHPLDWLQDFDRDSVEPLLYEGCDFILHGHLHRSGTFKLKDPDTEAMTIAAGACYQTRQYPNSYCFTQIKIEPNSQSTGAIYFRRYSHHRGGFWTRDTLTYRNVRDGVYSFTLPRRFGYVSSQSASNQREIESLELQLEVEAEILKYLSERTAKPRGQRPDLLETELDAHQAKLKSIQSRLRLLIGEKKAIRDSLPPRSEIFVGRKEELHTCLDALRSDQRGWGAIVCGMAGIGKTALALEVAYGAKHESRFDAYLFATAKTSRLTHSGVLPDTLASTSLDAFIRAFALQLGVEDIVEIPDERERRSAFRTSLKGRQVLLLWDNLETLNKDEQLEIFAFLRDLPSPNKALVTSRVQMGESAVSVRLDRLSEAESLLLMEGIASDQPDLSVQLRRAGRRARRALYEATGGNPLAMHWALGLVAYEEGCTIGTALDRLERVGSSSDFYEFFFREIVESLTQTERNVLTALAYFQTPAKPASLANAINLSIPPVEMALDRLVTVSIVHDLERGKYGLHPLARSYVRALLSVRDSQTETVQRRRILEPNIRWRVLLYWVSVARRYGGSGKDAYKTFDKLESELPNFEIAASALREISQSQRDTKNKAAASQLISLYTALRAFLWSRGYWNERMRLGRWAYESAVALEDWCNAAWRAYEVSRVYESLNDMTEVCAWIDRANEAIKQTQLDNDHPRATRLLGLLAEQRGKLSEAEEYFQRTTQTNQDSVTDLQKAVVLTDLGSVARKQGNYDLARSNYELALAVYEETGAKLHQAILYGKLGNLALTQRDLVNAKKWFRCELETAKVLERDVSVAAARIGLARVLEEEGLFRDALLQTEEALPIQERLHHRDLARTRKLLARLRDKADLVDRESQSDVLSSSSTARC